MRLLVVLLVGCSAASPAPTCPQPAAAGSIDEATVIAESRAFFAALDRHEATFADVLAPGFTVLANTRLAEEPTLRTWIDRRRTSGAPPRTRTWTEERVFLSTASATYVGTGIEHVPADGDAAAFDQEGWHSLVWVPDGGRWKIAHYQFQKGGLESERDFWNLRYRQATGFEAAPNRLLVETIKGRKPGTALDLMMGQGRNAVFLAREKWKVTGVDISDEGIRIATRTAAQHGVEIQAIPADVYAWDPGVATWDLVTLIYAGADPALVERIKPSVKQRGLVVIETFHADAEMARTAGGWKTGELAALFADGFIVLRDEVVEDVADWSQSRQKLVRFVAEKR